MLSAAHAFKTEKKNTKEAGSLVKLGQFPYMANFRQWQCRFEQAPSSALGCFPVAAVDRVFPQVKHEAELTTLTHPQLTQGSTCLMMMQITKRETPRHFRCKSSFPFCR